MRRLRALCAITLIACAETSTIDGVDVDEAGSPALDASSADGSSNSWTEGGSRSDDASISFFEGGDVADSQTEADSQTGADSTVVDAEQQEAGRDADGGALEASSEAGLEAGRDAGSDADPDGGDASKSCTNGENRCFEYQYQTCTNKTWTWQVGDQSCCHDDRFSVAGNTVLDSVTGKTWYRHGGRGSSREGSQGLCEAVIPGGRLPTSSELMAITIGAPIGNKSVCSPTLDKVAFQNVYAGDAWTSNGCVDLIRAISKTACGNADPFLCVKD